MTLTFFLAVIGWIIFRAENMTQATEYLARMFGTIVSNGLPTVGSNSGLVVMSTPLIWGTAMLLVEWIQRDKQHALQFPAKRVFNYRFVHWAIYYLILLIIAQYAGETQTFIYFQF